jgi:DeoR/GlpR family transcriptional regulator of sugar metabolism
MTERVSGSSAPHLRAADQSDGVPHRRALVEPASRPKAAACRQEWIMTALRSVGFLSITDLARELGVSHMTVRRDLHALAETGDVRMVHGGVSLSAESLRRVALSASAGSVAVFDDVEPGRAGVAERAAAMVGPTDTIALDAGPTALALAQALPADFHGSVITHSMPVLRLLDEQPSGATVVALGGELLAERHAFVGPATEVALEPLRARTFFVSPAAVDERGLYARTPAEASVQRRLIGIADRVVLVATHEVYTTSAPARIAPLDRLASLVSDRPPPRSIAVALGLANATTAIAAAELSSEFP